MGEMGCGTAPIENELARARCNQSHLPILTHKARQTAFKKAQQAINKADINNFRTPDHQGAMLESLRLAPDERQLLHRAEMAALPGTAGEGGFLRARDVGP